MSVEKAYDLIDDLQGVLNYTEGRGIVINGIDNVSISDLESTIYYAETYIRNGGTGFSGLMEPLDNVYKILKSYGLEDKSRGSFGW